MLVPMLHRPLSLLQNSVLDPLQHGGNAEVRREESQALLNKPRTSVDCSNCQSQIVYWQDTQRYLLLSMEHFASQLLPALKYALHEQAALTAPLSPTFASSDQLPDSTTSPEFYRMFTYNIHSFPLMPMNWRPPLPPVGPRTPESVLSWAQSCHRSQ